MVVAPTLFSEPQARKESGGAATASGSVELGSELLEK